MKLFPKEKVKGVFRGFSEGGLEFHADIILKYQSEFQSIPMHGQFLLVSLENDNEAVLGRITSISAQGRLSSSAGEDYGIRAAEEDRVIPEDLREQYLKYRVDIRVLGVLRIVKDQLVFSPSHRRLPHVGSKVAFLSDELLKEVAGHNLKNEDGKTDAAEFGYFSLGEFIYAGNDNRLKPEGWMQVKSPLVIPKFPIKQLVARRSFVFARAGFGKSNLVKLLFSNLYKTIPTILKKNNKEVPVGTIIFDPDGEYFWPDDKGRPGLCDIPELEDKVVVFTKKEGPSEYYGSFIGGNIKLDIRRLKPSEVISIALPAENQDQQNIRKLKALKPSDWSKLVNEIYQNGNSSDDGLIRDILKFKESEDAQLNAARANMTFIVGLLHDPSSQMMDMVFSSLRAGRICVIDISQMRGKAGLILSGIILHQIFEHNQLEFTKANPQSIPTIAVLEEAQSVLGNTGGAESPYVAWVKEGRKYDLGAVLITQQPGSISSEILSQGDNWFLFHLLSSGDLKSVKAANAHFSDDLLSALLNEPIPGNGIFWSSAGGKTYPIPIRVLSFEGMYKAKDINYKLSAGKTFASELRAKFESALKESRAAISAENAQTKLELGKVENEVNPSEQTEDVQRTYVVAAIEKLKNDNEAIEKIKKYGIPWKGFTEALKKYLPEIMENKDEMAHQNVVLAMNTIFGPQDEKWESTRKDSKSRPGAMTTWLMLK